ncbi:MAG TPA: 4-(cytidine 5'-diphospho)-2-C-methyl-D-erythritol kinase [Bacteroidales bacterium]|nr:4-(cytidine 5'-diphospho)-2-C-methyl-D-erythritol kinase [Bacteroidales bacterium]HOH22674.1 4-(cytidine 5'-diphospho)-2-C-methyl-D-erythritol kinase [Bacteroidales bacterium]HPB58065.1 4-(cytidine 5'-diphospho)-2-C-methyl-D-erythritol kinase [Bacteroidales bacterium]HPZ03870.1 4-(cytidine 5'-diphospho)-2-C-methyl-D-erythritol kinase [Bacteroidales bacterium]HQB75397.1 4-(cytidine 5'-diphospho)-2-C-methyl-D-erythritol kinase [Bacteroidales bacterium]
MIIETHFKINLGLHVLKKMESGYHQVETVLYPVYSQRDRVEIVRSDHFKFQIENQDFEIEQEKNIVVKAYRLLEKNYDLPPVSIRLVKNIPSGAGIGGGSANGALTLKLLNSLFDLRLTTEQLHCYAAQLGSDVPFFLRDYPCWATGVGDQLQPIALDLSAYRIEVAFSDIRISTAEAYSWVTPKIPPIPLSELIQRPIQEWRSVLVNDFEKPIFLRYPQLELTKENFYKKGALYSAMSGSGSSVFAIFNR